MDSEEGGADPLILQRRAEIKDAYTRLLVEHPALPPEIRNFQVAGISSWKPAHCHSFVFITGWCNYCCAVRRPWSHPQFCANRVGEDAPMRKKRVWPNWVVNRKSFFIIIFWFSFDCLFYRSGGLDLKYLFSGLVCFLWQPWLLLKPTKWAGLKMFICSSRQQNG